MSNYPKLELWIDAADGVVLSYWDFERGEDVHYILGTESTAVREENHSDTVSIVNLSESLKALFNKITKQDAEE